MSSIPSGHLIRDKSRDFLKCLLLHYVVSSGVRPSGPCRSPAAELAKLSSAATEAVGLVVRMQVTAATLKIGNEYSSDIACA